MWQQDGVNFLIQRDIGRLVYIVTGIISVFMTAFYVRHRLPAYKRRCVAYCVVALLLQLGVVKTIDNHSVERFPM